MTETAKIVKAKLRAANAVASSLGGGTFSDWQAFLAWFTSGQSSAYLPAGSVTLGSAPDIRLVFGSVDRQLLLDDQRQSAKRQLIAMKQTMPSAFNSGPGGVEFGKGAPKSLFT